MGLLGTVETFLWSKAVKKAAVTLAQAAGSYIAAHAGILQSWGVTASVDPNAVTAALIAGSEVGRNFLKMRFPKAFGWL